MQWKPGGQGLHWLCPLWSWNWPEVKQQHIKKNKNHWEQSLLYLTSSKKGSMYTEMEPYKVNGALQLRSQSRQYIFKIEYYSTSRARHAIICALSPTIRALAAHWTGSWHSATNLTIVTWRANIAINGWQRSCGRRSLTAVKPCENTTCHINKNLQEVLWRTKNCLL